MNIRGFTLIELLVVVAIIGLLSSVVLASVNSARTKAKDTQRVAIARQIAHAIELYYDDHGSYPNWAIAPHDATGEECGYQDTWCDLEIELAPYISSLPKGDVINYRWQYKRSYERWGLSVVLDEPNSLSQNDGGYYTNRFELGVLPAYCLEQYSGADANWANPWIGEGAWTAFYRQIQKGNMRSALKKVGFEIVA